MIDGQRLGLEHVEVGVRESAGIERGEEVALDELRAATDVDDAGARGQQVQAPRVEEAPVVAEVEIGEGAPEAGETAETAGAEAGESDES